MQMHPVLCWRMSDAELSKNEAKAWTRLVRAHRLIIDTLERDLKNAGLPVLAWHDILRELAAAPERRLRPAAMEAAMGLAQYHLSRLIDKLAGEGLVIREKLADDGRGQWVVLTEAGAALDARMAAQAGTTLQTHFAARLEGDSARKLAKLLGRLLPGHQK